jgi:hypothetical protein
VGVGVGVGVAVRVTVRVGVGVGVDDRVGVGVADRVGVGVADRVGVGVGVGVAWPAAVADVRRHNATPSAREKRRIGFRFYNLVDDRPRGERDYSK